MFCITCHMSLDLTCSLVRSPNNMIGLGYNMSILIFENVRGVPSYKVQIFDSTMHGTRAANFSKSERDVRRRRVLSVRLPRRDV